MHWNSLDDLRSFVYRRLAAVSTCSLQVFSGGDLCLRSKHDIASASDVFLHPFYWQLLSLMPKPPVHVIDLGAHLGHFTMLTESCIQCRFGRSDAHYSLVEANPRLVPSLQRNLKRAGLAGRSTVICGAVGLEETGNVDFWIDRARPMASSVDQKSGASRVKAHGVQLASVAPGCIIDILKIDIEGAEYELLERIGAELSRVKLVMIEFHSPEKPCQARAEHLIRTAGLHPTGISWAGQGRLLAAFLRT